MRLLQSWNTVTKIVTEILFWLYRGVMYLKKNRDTLPPWQRYPAYLFVAIGYIADVAYQVIFGTTQFLDFPRELTFTARLKRYKYGSLLTPVDLWRYEKALAICTRLDPYDPSGGHC